MDILSITADLRRMSGVVVRIISELSEFIDNIDSPPYEVQSMSNELGNFYSYLGKLKVALEAHKLDSFPTQCMIDIGELVNDFDYTLNQLRRLVEKAKEIETSKKSATELWKTVKFTFKDDQVRALRTRLWSHGHFIGTVLWFSSETRVERMEKCVEDIHRMVVSIPASRDNVKKLLGPLENEQDPEQRTAVDQSLSDRSKKPPQELTPRLSNDKNLPHAPMPNVQTTTQSSAAEAFQLTRSAKEEAAFRRAKEGSWPITWLTRCKPTELNNASILGGPFGPQHEIQVSCTTFLRILLMKSDNKLSNSDPQESFVLFPYFTILRLGNSIQIIPNKLAASGPVPGFDKVIVAETNNQIKIEFATDNATTTFYDCLEGLQSLYRRIWEHRALVKSLIDDAATITPTELEIRAVNEFKISLSVWTAFRIQSTPLQTPQPETSKQTIQSSTQQTTQIFTPAPTTQTTSPTQTTKTTTPAIGNALAYELVEAAKEGQIARINATLASDVSVDSRYNGWTALGRAAQEGQLGVVRTLLDHGANVDLIMANGFLYGGGTALNWAAKGGFAKIVKLLIDRRADLSVACQKELLPGHEATPLVLAAAYDHLEVVKILTAAIGAQEQDSQGYEAFMVACRRGSEPMVAYFVKELKYDLKRKTTDGNGYTALHMAALGQNSSIMQLLIDAGANVNEKDNNGETPLQLAESRSLSRSEAWLRMYGKNEQMAAWPNKPFSFGGSGNK